MNPKMLLVILVGTVPLVVAAAMGTAFLLARAGYGAVVWGLVPFLGLLIVTGLLALALGRAAGRSRERRPGDGDDV